MENTEDARWAYPNLIYATYRYSNGNYCYVISDPNSTATVNVLPLAYNYIQIYSMKFYGYPIYILHVIEILTNLMLLKSKFLLYTLSAIRCTYVYCYLHSTVNFLPKSDNYCYDSKIRYANHSYPNNLFYFLPSGCFLGGSQHGRSLKINMAFNASKLCEPSVNYMVSILRCIFTNSLGRVAANMYSILVDIRWLEKARFNYVLDVRKELFIADRLTTRFSHAEVGNREGTICMASNHIILFSSKIFRKLHEMLLRKNCKITGELRLHLADPRLYDKAGCAKLLYSYRWRVQSVMVREQRGSSGTRGPAAAFRRNLKIEVGHFTTASKQWFMTIGTGKIKLVLDMLKLSDTVSCMTLKSACHIRLNLSGLAWCKLARYGLAWRKLASQHLVFEIFGLNDTVSGIIKVYAHCLLRKLAWGKLARCGLAWRKLASQHLVFEIFGSNDTVSGIIKVYAHCLLRELAWGNLASQRSLSAELVLMYKLVGSEETDFSAVFRCARAWNTTAKLIYNGLG